MEVTGTLGSKSLDAGIRVVFFFQAEDGIRDSSVTGVQTCALPISLLEFPDIPRITSIVYEIGILGPARGFRPFYVGKVERAHRTLGNRLGEYLVARDRKSVV